MSVAESLLAHAALYGLILLVACAAIFASTRRASQIVPASLVVLGCIGVAMQVTAPGLSADFAMGLISGGLIAAGAILLIAARFSMRRNRG